MDNGPWAMDTIAAVGIVNGRAEEQENNSRRVGAVNQAQCRDPMSTPFSSFPSRLEATSRLPEVFFSQHRQRLEPRRVRQAACKVSSISNGGKAEDVEDCLSSVVMVGCSTQQLVRRVHHGLLDAVGDSGIKALTPQPPTWDLVRGARSLSGASRMRPGALIRRRRLVDEQQQTVGEPSRLW